MKKLIVWLLLLLPVASAQTTQTIYYYTSLSVSSYTVPSSLEPGEEGNLVITVSNVGTLYAKNVKLRLSTNPFVELGGYEYDLQTISAGKSSQVVIPVKVSSTTRTGTLVISYEIEYNEGDSSGSRTIEGAVGLSIERRPSLEIVNIEFDKEDIIPGSEVTVSLTVKNVGKGEARDITMSLDVTNLPFVPISTTEIFVGDMDSRDTKNVEIRLIVNEEAEIKAYSLPLRFSYYTETGDAKTEEETIGIRISGEPEFVVTLDETKNLYTNSIGEVSFSIANRGIGTAKYLTIKVDSELKFTPTEYYVGNIEPDDYETADFNVNLLGITPGTYSVTLHLLYKDPYNRETSMNKTFEITVGKQVTTNRNYWLILAIAMIILVWKRKSIKKFLKK